MVNDGPVLRLQPMAAPRYCRASHALKLAERLGHSLSWQVPTMVAIRRVARTRLLPPTQPGRRRHPGDLLLG